MIPFLLDYSTGFETGDGSEFPLVEGAVAWDGSVLPPTGYSKYSLHVTHNGSSVNYVRGYDATTARQWVTFKTRIKTLPGSGYAYLIHFESGSGLAIQSTGKLALIKNTGSVTLESNTVLSLNTWYKICFTNYDYNSGACYCEIRIDDEIDACTTSTVSGGTGSSQQVFLGDNGNGDRALPPASEYYLDDVVISLTQFVPDEYSVIILKPKADGYYDEWAGDAYDKTQTNDGDTSYISTSAANSKQTCTVQTPVDAGYALPTTYKVMGLIFNYCCRSTSGTSNMSLLLRIDGTDYPIGPIAFAVNASYYGRATMFTKNYNTNLSWTMSDLDTLEFGFSAGASAYANWRCTQMAIHAVVGYITNSSSVAQLSGIEMGDLSEFLSPTGVVSASQDVVHSGLYSLKVSATTTNIGYVPLTICSHRGLVTFLTDDATSESTLDIRTTYINFYFYPDTIPSSAEEIFFRFQVSGNYLVARINSAGNILLYNGTTYLATSGQALSTGTWYNLGFSLTTATSGSTAYSMEIDGIPSLSGTAAFGNLTPVVFVFGRTVNLNSNTVLYYFDDIVVNTDAFQTLPYTIRAVFPDGDGDGLTSEWLGKDGVGSTSVYEATDETPPDTTTYAYPDDTVGDWAHHAVKFPPVSDLPEVVDGLKAIKICALGRALTGSNLVSVGLYVPSKWVWLTVEALASTYINTSLRTAIFGEDVGDQWRTWKRSRLDQIQVGLLAPLVNADPVRETVISIQLLSGDPLDPLPMIAYQFGG